MRTGGAFEQVSFVVPLLCLVASIGAYCVAFGRTFRSTGAAHARVFRRTRDIHQLSVLLMNKARWFVIWADSAEAMIGFVNTLAYFLHSRYAYAAASLSRQRAVGFGEFVDWLSLNNSVL